MLRPCALLALPPLAGGAFISTIGAGAYVALQAGWTSDPFMAVMSSMVVALVCLTFATFVIEGVAKKDWFYRFNAQYETLREVWYQAVLRLIALPLVLIRRPLRTPSRKPERQRLKI